MDGYKSLGGESFEEPEYIEAVEANEEQYGAPLYNRVGRGGRADEQGEYVFFGSYPATRVNNRRLESTLGAMAGKLPSAKDRQRWTSYGYCYGNGEDNKVRCDKDYMWYINLEHEGQRYRGVYFTEYRPYFASYKTDEGCSCQSDNKYTSGTVYWFIFEPILWRIFSQESGKLCLISDKALDARAYQDFYETIGGDSYITLDSKPKLDKNKSKIFANNYEHSAIRRWLGEDFLNTAFSIEECKIIALQAVDNSASTLERADSRIACPNTFDAVALPSYSELMQLPEAMRVRMPTDYAKCQGVNVSARGSRWLLRSPHSDKTKYVSVACGYGSADVNATSSGIVPMLWIRL